MMKNMNTNTKIWSLMTATLFSGLLVSGTTTAAEIICTDPELNHMSMDDSQASACLDSGLGNLQGDSTLDPFLSGVGSEYTFLEKSTGTSSPTPMYSLSYTDEDNGSGTWEFDSSVWDSYGTIALGFKFGGGNEPDNWFVYELVSGVSSGDWLYDAEQGQGLSHMNIYAKDSVEVPEPGTLALFGLGIVGLTLTRRKTRAS
ncbi:PEP-CTERM sorting domain-containing protein [Marinobacter orientalis]|uniref:PEP-CTERM sorting domain-containing protein n=1 Tax=Marinobacter orientalis TaxID=1928859 RepID=A0A7Y0WRV0_9GAMM|nr:PEP-CTERM sorting domain-containing protein [Marinobacter orientalis]NMT63309.1 PEP-CTERM sorting domain-containing protein [Marinobacter orientalis]TGX51955.1 PEP-CTERM sorting domain-containing protein [Marinobacter orientalis]